MRDWLFVEDHVRAIDLIFHEGNRVKHIISAGTTNGRTSTWWKNVQADGQTAGAEKAAPVKTWSPMLPTAPGDLRYAIDATKLKKELGWEPSPAIWRRVGKDHRLVPEQPGLARPCNQRRLPEVLRRHVQQTVIPAVWPFTHKRDTMKGIILASGSGTRLYPHHHGHQQATHAHLRQADDLLSAEHFNAGGYPRYYHHHSGRSATIHQAARRWSQWGCRFAYEVQEKPNSLAQAFVIGKKFRQETTAWHWYWVIIYFTEAASAKCSRLLPTPEGATIFAYRW